MKELNLDNFCVLPFVSMQIRSDSTLSACCMNGGSAKTKTGDDVYLYRDSLEEAVKSDYFVDLRNTLERGERHWSCGRCYSDDDIGIRSRRKNENENHAHWIENIKRGVYPDHPLVFDLNLGSLCNLKCRICGSTSSSKWVQEYVDLFGEDHIPRGNAELRAMPVEESRALLMNWPEKNPEFYVTLRKWMANAERLEFFGGEPMLNKRHFELLRQAVEMGGAKNQVLRYATNGTVFPEEIVEKYWPHFKEIHLNISVDGIGRQFEYQRFGANWEKVLANVERYKRLGFVKWVSINISVSTFSIYNLPDYHQFWNERGIQVNLNNYVTDPERFDIRILPPALKEKVRQKYEPYFSKVIPSSRQELEAALQFMFSEDRSKAWPRFLESVWFHDGYRKQFFGDFFPDIYRHAKDAGLWYDYATQKEYFAQ